MSTNRGLDKEDVVCIYIYIYIYIYRERERERERERNITQPLKRTKQCHLQLHGWTYRFSLEKEMATHSSILAWKIPWTEEPGGLNPLGLLRVGHDRGTNTQRFSYWVKSDRERQISYDITYMWNLKKRGVTNELIYKTELDLQR